MSDSSFCPLVTSFLITSLVSSDLLFYGWIKFLFHDIIYVKFFLINIIIFYIIYFFININNDINLISIKINKILKYIILIKINLHKFLIYFSFIGYC